MCLFYQNKNGVHFTFVFCVPPTVCGTKMLFSQCFILDIVIFNYKVFIWHFLYFLFLNILYLMKRCHHAFLYFLLFKGLISFNSLHLFILPALKSLYFKFDIWSFSKANLLHWSHFSVSIFLLLKTRCFRLCWSNCGYPFSWGLAVIYFFICVTACLTYFMRPIIPSMCILWCHSLEGATLGI